MGREPAALRKAVAKQAPPQPPCQQPRKHHPVPPTPPPPPPPCARAYRSSDEFAATFAVARTRPSRARTCVRALACADACLPRAGKLERERPPPRLRGSWRGHALRGAPAHSLTRLCAPARARRQFVRFRCSSCPPRANLPDADQNWQCSETQCTETRLLAMHGNATGSRGVAVWCRRVGRTAGR